MLTRDRIIYNDILEKIVTPTALILIDDDVVKVYYNADIELNAETANENVEAVWDIIKRRKIFNMVIPDSTTRITMGVNEVSNERFERIKKGEALIIKTLGHRILAKAFVNARKHKYPVRIFDCENDAEAWFNKLREQELDD